MESAGKGAAIFRKKPRRDLMEKDQRKSVVSEFFLSAEHGVGSFDESGFKSKYRWKGELPWARIENLASS